MTTLLEKAKGLPHKNIRNVTDEDVELALAWIKDEITSTQVSTVYGMDSNKYSNYMYRLARSLKKAYQEGKLIIE